MKVVVFAPDLGDRSRIDAALGQIDEVGSVERVRTVDELIGAAPGADLVIVDLERPGVIDVAVDLVSAAGRVIGFGPHVATELLDGATAAGVDALARSRFFADVRAAVGS
jgi:hypothetical protein